MTSPAVQVTVTCGPPTPLQLSAWRRLWQILLPSSACAGGGMAAQNSNAASVAPEAAQD